MTNRERAERLAYNLLRATADLMPYRQEDRRVIAREYRQGFEGERDIHVLITGYRSAIQKAISELVSRRDLAEDVAERERKNLTAEYLPADLVFVEETPESA